MNVYRAKDLDDRSLPIRLHPYTGSQHGDEDVDYYDFKKHPELIRTNLADFKPYDEHEAIQKFYELLDWLNTSDESYLESNDCAFIAPSKNISPRVSSKGLQCSGRLMVFYRNLVANVQNEGPLWLLDSMNECLEETDPEFQDGSIGLCFFNTAFVELYRKIGKELVIEFWAFGDTEEEVYENLNRLFDNLFHCFKSVCDFIQQQLRRRATQS